MPTARTLPPALLLALLAAIASPADAQKNCRKGIPCGNTCISAKNTCRIGTSPRPTEPRSEGGATGASAPDARGLTSAPRAAESTARGIVSTPAGDSIPLPWAIADGTLTFYSSACEGALSIPLGKRLYFAKTTELERLGAKRASVTEEKCTIAALQEHERRLRAAGQ